MVLWDGRIAGPCLMGNMPRKRNHNAIYKTADHDIAKAHQSIQGSTDEENRLVADNNIFQPNSWQPAYEADE